MANTLLGIFLCLILSACGTPSTAPTTDERGWSAGETERSKKLFVDGWTTPSRGEAAEIHKRIASSMTGSASFAYIIPTFFDPTHNSPMLTLVHQGEYPLYDLTVRILDMATFDNLVRQNNSYSDKLREEVQLRISNIAPNQSSMLKTVQLGTDPLKWNLFFNARNGFFTELLRVRRVGNEWKTALKVIRTRSPSNDQVLLEKIDSGYPLSKDGQVEW
ncbi:hypothetical protein AYO43_01305 [Nitrospira sp. SCGC AG-212-E16]|nr:hypothetical protein AYO43_01305 [Nitrospira sp. SCGC AG-212-E16]